MEHPFEDSAKLRILNAKYTIPESDTKYTVFHDLISKYSGMQLTMYMCLKNNLPFEHVACTEEKRVMILKAASSTNLLQTCRLSLQWQIQKLLEGGVAE